MSWHRNEEETFEQMIARRPLLFDEASKLSDRDLSEWLSDMILEAKSLRTDAEYFANRGEEYSYEINDCVAVGYLVTTLRKLKE